MCNITCTKTICMFVYICWNHKLFVGVPHAPTLHNEYIISKTLLLLQANLNLEGFLPPDELYKFKILLSRKCNLEWILTRAIPKSKPAPAHAPATTTLKCAFYFVTDIS